MILNAWLSNLCQQYIHKTNGTGLVNFLSIVEHFIIACLPVE